MLWLRRNGDFVATTKRGQYTIYRAHGRTLAVSFKPSGTHTITRDIGLFNSLTDAKQRAEQHLTTAPAFGSRSRSNSRFTRFSRVYGNRGKGNYRVVIYGRGAISGFATARRASEWARSELSPRARFRVERVKRGRRS